MIVILSPAKTLDFETNNNFLDYTIPKFLDHSEELIKELKKISLDDISTLMNLSPSLSLLNFNRYHTWDKTLNLSNSRQSILCFKGGVYVGLNVENFSNIDLEYSQNYLRIISGLHGVLAPFDLIKPYRLEMGTKLKTNNGKNLYDFWGDKITNSLNDTIKKNNSRYLINLASNEYSKSIKLKNIKAKIIDVKFLDKKKDKYKIISFFSKKARGSMASFIMKNKVKSVSVLKTFSGLGYEFYPSESNEQSLVFIR